jgi:hypothetical protein
MPLVRYELRNELGLANPQLYRTAGKDDSQALLAGVAMAGLVGIIRQLGDLAEYVVHYSLEYFLKRILPISSLPSFELCCCRLDMGVTDLTSSRSSYEFTLESL